MHEQPNPTMTDPRSRGLRSRRFTSLGLALGLVACGGSAATGAPPAPTAATEADGDAVAAIAGPAAPVAWTFDGSAPALAPRTTWRASDADCATECGVSIDAVAGLPGGDLLVYGDAFRTGRRRGPPARAFDLAGAPLAPGGWRWGLRARLAPDGTARWARLFRSSPSASAMGTAERGGQRAWAWGVLAAAGLARATLALDASRTVEGGANETVAWLARHDVESGAVDAHARIAVSDPWDVAVTQLVPAPNGRGMWGVAMVGCGQAGPCSGPLPGLHATGNAANDTPSGAWGLVAGTGGGEVPPRVDDATRYTAVASWLFAVDETGQLRDATPRFGPGDVRLACMRAGCLLLTTRRADGSRETHLEVRRVGPHLDVDGPPLFETVDARGVVTAVAGEDRVWVVASHVGYGPVLDDPGSVLRVFDDAASAPSRVELAESKEVRVVGERDGRALLTVGPYVQAGAVGLVEVDREAHTARALATLPLEGWFLQSVAVADGDLVWVLAAAGDPSPAMPRTRGLSEESRVLRAALPR